LDQLTDRAVNVLFTSVGRRVELLRAFRRAYESLKLGGNIVAVDIDPLAPALRAADRTYLVPRVSSPDYILVLLEICQLERVDLIFPLIDPDVPVLAEFRSAIEATGARVAAVSMEAAHIAADKWLTVAFFRRVGVPTPKSWLPDQLKPGRANYPLFLKPRDGSAAQQTYKVNNARELAFFKEYVRDPIIQEYLPGPEITNDVVCGVDGEILGVVSRERIEVRWGEVAKGVTVYNPEIIQACVKIAKALPAIGPVTVQCMMKAGIPYFTEINARMGGGLPLGIAAGADSPRWLLARAAGLLVEIPPLGSYQTGLHLTRFDESYFLTEAERERMASGHL
jgi:carbamoyl-phosphate synthase large subunit